MYRQAAQVYDLLYTFKDYAADTRILLRLLRGRFRPQGKRLLEVGCGTGLYLEQLKDRFDVVGVDLEPAMLRVARRRVPGVPLHRADMRDFDLGRSFDVVLCLFSTIGYAQNRRELRAAVGCMARHLAPGGILVVEPWWRYEEYRPQSVHSMLAKSETVHVARATVSRRRGRKSILDMHHLVATRHGVRHFVERHVLYMARAEEIRAAFVDAGLTVENRTEGLAGRGLWVGVKPRASGAVRKLRGK